MSIHTALASEFVDSSEKITSSEWFGDVVVHTGLEASFTVTNHCEVWSALQTLNGNGEERTSMCR